LKKAALELLFYCLWYSLQWNTKGRVSRSCIRLPDKIYLNLPANISAIDSVKYYQSAGLSLPYSFISVVILL